MMAGNKINTKTKGKEDKSKINKSGNQCNEESEELDFSLLRKPIHTSVTGFAQARKIFDLATEELKDLLTNECDLLYECKVCRNIFRSLANFLTHKRVYCKEKFNTSLHSHFMKTTSALSELLKIKETEKNYQESLIVKNDLESMNVDTTDNDRIPLTKDLTTIVEKITKQKGILDNNLQEEQLTLQKIPKSSVAVFQNINFRDKDSDTMRKQVKELDDILSQENAVLQSDGKFKIQSCSVDEKTADLDNVIQISDDEDNNDSDSLKCKICDLQFSTLKTLKFHKKHKHLESRLVYPCPDCLEIFSTSWSVYRHLFKVHRKTAAQIRRLRESIQAKAFRMNNPPAFYEKRKNNVKNEISHKISEEERLDQENQAWMDNMEGDGELPRCGGCGRTFERRAALAAHTYTCQTRSRALARRPQETKKIEIQIRKDYNKGPPPNIALTQKIPDITDKVAGENSTQTITSSKPQQERENNRGGVDKGLTEATMNIIETSHTKQQSINKDVNGEILENKINELKTFNKLPFAQQTENNNMSAFKQRMQMDVNLEKNLCKKCDTKCNKMSELYEHMSEHYKWMRYACKLCNYKHYNFDKLPEHVKVVHKLKGDTDFYFSTIKAIDGPEALELAEPVEDANDTNETSPDSRRPSRCSSDSSRLSDDSSSSSTRMEGARKRKMNQNRNNAKRKKEIISNEDAEEQKDPESSNDKDMSLVDGEISNSKVYEENSSDLDDVDEKLSRRHVIEDTSSVASRRPVRKRTKPKNEDFEYDLSNLLKMEAQGYRDSQTVTSTKNNQNKKKTSPENNNDIINKDCCGALYTLSKKAVDRSVAHMKINNLAGFNISKDPRTSNIFVRPMLPKIPKVTISPKKDCAEEKETSTNSFKILKSPEAAPGQKDDTPREQNDTTINNDSKSTDNKAENLPITQVTDNDKSKTEEPSKTQSDTVKPKPVIPIKFRRQSIDVINNPLIKKNITDFTKAGMKTKILVIKPINRNIDGSQSGKSPLKFQTIKLKDPNKATSSCEEKPNDQVVVVQVPKVECTIPRVVNNTNKINSENSSSNVVTLNNADNENTTKPDDESQKCLKQDNQTNNVELNPENSDLSVSNTDSAINKTESLVGAETVIESANSS